MSKSYSLAKALAEFSISLNKSLAAQLTGDLINDTRLLKPDDIFCAVKGSQSDGRMYIDKAMELGAAFILVQSDDIDEHGSIDVKTISNDDSDVSRQVHIIYFYQLELHLFSLAKAYYKVPQSSMKIIGITGTNGKTSTCQLIAMLLKACQEKVAIIGTTGAGELNALKPIENTTPGATQLHQILAGFKEDNIEYVAMEVSSHALEQRRVNADLFDIALFTNISRDHLDYHKSMASYAEAKYQIFSYHSAQTAIINGDDPQAQKWLKSWPKGHTPIVYGCSDFIEAYPNYIQAKYIYHTSAGSTFLLVTPQGEVEISTHLMGKFNIYNLLAAISVMIELKFDLTLIAESVKSCKAITGRMEVFQADDKPTTIVDYAHTPDALLNALEACKFHCKGKLWVIFGCGGDRDMGKRSLMGDVAEKHADHIVLTNDNPRNESPEVIIHDILAGCKHPENVVITLDREIAIKETIAQANVDDMVLVAGKGHEEYIWIGNEKRPYNERHFVQSTYLSEAVS